MKNQNSKNRPLLLAKKLYKSAIEDIQKNRIESAYLKLFKSIQQFKTNQDSCITKVIRIWQTKIETLMVVLARDIEAAYTGIKS